jgi:hypothetical protein
MLTVHSPFTSIITLHYACFTSFATSTLHEVSARRSIEHVYILLPFAETVKRAAMQCAPTAASSGPTVDSPKTVTLKDVTLFTTASAADAADDVCDCAVRFAAVSAVLAVAVVIPQRLLSESELFCL